MPKSTSAISEGKGSQPQNAPAKAKSTKKVRKSSEPIVPFCTGTILAKLNIEHLKEHILKSMRSGEDAPEGREECIQYALEIVLSSLIVNGYLKPYLAEKMREPPMIAEINKICEDMIAAQSEIMAQAMIKSRDQQRLKNKNKLKRSGSSSQITVPNPMSREDQDKKSRQLSQKASRQPSAIPSQESIKKGKPLKASKASEEIIKKVKPKKSVLPVDQKTTGKKVQEKSKKNKSEEAKPNEGTSSDEYVHRKITKDLVQLSQDTPEQPQDVNSNNNEITTDKPRPTILKRRDSSKHCEDVNKGVKIVGSVTTLDDNGNRGVEPLERTNPAKAPPPAGTNKEAFDDLTTNGPPVTQRLSDIIQSQSITSVGSAKTKTLDKFIVAPCPMSASTPDGFQIAVDLNGFQNNEISMEVEDRQLIFLASRPKTEQQSLRKVTEIVEVPLTVNMENLKIGRRVDGCVVIEEHRK